MPPDAVVCIVGKFMLVGLHFMNNGKILYVRHSFWVHLFSLSIMELLSNNNIIGPKRQ